MGSISAILSAEAQDIYDNWSRKGRSGVSKGDRISRCIVFYEKNNAKNRDGLLHRVNEMEKNINSLQLMLTEKFEQVIELQNQLASKSEK